MSNSAKQQERLVHLDKCVKELVKSLAKPKNVLEFAPELYRSPAVFCGTTSHHPKPTTVPGTGGDDDVSDVESGGENEDDCKQAAATVVQIRREFDRPLGHKDVRARCCLCEDGLVETLQMVRSAERLQSLDAVFVVHGSPLPVWPICAVCCGRIKRQEEGP